MYVFKEYIKLFIKWMSRKKIRYGLWPDNASYEDKNQGNKSWLQSHSLLVLGGSFIINTERFYGSGSSTSYLYSAS